MRPRRNEDGLRPDSVEVLLRAGAGFAFGAVLGVGFVMFEPSMSRFDAALVIGGAGAALAAVAVFFGDNFWSWISRWWG